MKLILHFVMYGGSILILGTDYHHKKFLPGIDDLSSGLGCFAMTELGHGSNVRALQTTAKYNKETREFHINTPHFQAQKYWIGNAGTATRAIVFAQLYIKEECFGVHPFIVQLREDENSAPLPGIIIQPCGLKGGVNGLDTCKIWFNDVKIPRENLLNRFGGVTIRGKYKTPIKTPRDRLQACLAELTTTRLISSIGNLNMSRMALFIATVYSTKRTQFSSSNYRELSFKKNEEILMSYRIHQLRLIPHIVDNYAIKAFSDKLKKLYTCKNMSKELHVLIASLKIVASDHVFNASQSCRECCGGQGCLSSNYITNCRNDADIFKTLEADNLLLAQHVAGFAVSKFADEYGKGIGQFYYAGRCFISFFQENYQSTDDKYILAKEEHKKAFTYREFHLARSLATRIRRRVEKGQNMFDIWNELGDHVTLLGTAFIERCVHEAFVDAIDQIPKESSIKNILTDLCSFYALWHIMKDKSWFLERKYFSPAKTKAMRRLTNQLCQKISEYSLSLVQAWDIPDLFFEGTIGSKFPLIDTPATSSL